MKQAWPIIEPGNPFIHGWHLEGIAEHLQACTKGDLRKIVINLPPRHCKSILISVMWFCWSWTRWPESRWMCSSYSQNLSTRDNIKCRTIIESDWYRKWWGDSFKLRGDQNQKTRFDNTKTGFRLATSVGGLALGEGADFILCDDPLKVIDAESLVTLQSTSEWWDLTMSTRGNDPKTVRHVIVMQRISEADLSGHVLASDLGYEHLCFPAEFDSSKRKKPTVLGFTDPRKEDGELLWPERFGRKEIDLLKKQLGAFGTAGQLQQEPVPRGGGLIKSHWFRYYTIQGAGESQCYILHDSSGKARRFLASQCFLFQTCDTAMKEGQKNDYTAVGTFVLTPAGDLLVLEIWREKIDAALIFNALMNRREKFEGLMFQAVEDRQSGTQIIQLGALKGKPFRSLKADQDKVRRAIPIATMYENGKVFHLQCAEWLTDFEREVQTFPASAHDDQVDVLSYAGQLVLHDNLTSMVVDRQLVYSDEPETDAEKERVESFLDRMGID